MDPEVYARIKPLNYKYTNCFSKNDKELILSLPENHKYGAKKTQVFSFDKIFDSDSNQIDLINQVCKPTINDLFHGINSLLIIHGANKSGKEYTIYGNESENGILQASFFHLFHLIKECTRKIPTEVSTDSDEKSLYKYHRRVPYKQKTVLKKIKKYSVFISYIGLVDNEFIDLLEIENSKKKNKANEIKIETINEAIELLLFGLASRNESISHRILTLKLSLGNNRYSKLSIVDLAYQNNLKQTECVSTSVMALRNCFETLKEKRYADTKIPYRESKLTWALKNFLCTESKIKIMLCLNPASEELNHTCNVLKFANIKFDFESNFNSTSTPKITEQSAFFKNFVDYDKIDNELFEQDIYEKCTEDKSNDEKIVTIDYDEPENFKRQQDITKLIKCLNEIHSKIDHIRFSQSFDLKINDFTSELERYLNKKSNYSLRKSSVATFGNVTESFTKISTLKNVKEHTFQLNQYSNIIDPKIDISPKIKKLSTHLKNALKINRNDSFELKNGVPVANRRGKKRSKSVDVWLDHKPQNMVKLDTLMQPIMSKKYSVKKVEFRDTKKSSKYVLTHQQQDESGEVVTNLIKGDIIKSPSGGSSVIFTDIERLHLKSPKLAKPKHRKSLNILEKNPFIIEDKCAIGIEGHPKIGRNLTFR